MAPLEEVLQLFEGHPARDRVIKAVQRRVISHLDRLPYGADQNDLYYLTIVWLHYLERWADHFDLR